MPQAFLSLLSCSVVVQHTFLRYNLALFINLLNMETNPFDDELNYELLAAGITLLIEAADTIDIDAVAEIALTISEDAHDQEIIDQEASTLQADNLIKAVKRFGDEHPELLGNGDKSLVIIKILQLARERVSNTL